MQVLKISTILIFSLLSLGTMASNSQEGSSVPRACGEQSLDVLNGLGISNLTDVTSCGDNPTGRPVDYCECLSNLFGNTITKSQEYQDFRDKVNSFDRKESRVQLYANETETKILAALANLVGGAQKTDGSSPIETNEACSEQFTKLEERLNGSEDSNTFSADALKSILASQRDYDSLTELGMGPESINNFLSNYWTVSSPEAGAEGPTGVFHRAEFENPAMNLFFESMGYYQSGQGMVELQVQAIAASKQNGSSLSLSASDALPALCESLAKRFETSYSARNVAVPTGTYLDVNGHISEKSLTPNDMGTFEGLKERFFARSRNENFEFEEADLFFNQMMCTHLNEETFGPIEPSESPEVRALTEEALIRKIETNNSYLRKSAREYEALSEYKDAQEIQVNQMKAELSSLLSQVGIDPGSIESISEKSSSELQAFKENLFNGQSIDNEIKADILNKVSDLYENTLSLDEYDEKYSVLMLAIADRQIANNELMRELSSRVGGVVIAASKIDRSRSFSSEYFARFDYGRNFQGPMPSDAIVFEGDQKNSGSIRKSMANDVVDSANVVVASRELEESDIMGTEEKKMMRNLGTSINKGSFTNRNVARFSSGENEKGIKKNSLNILGEKLEDENGLSRLEGVDRERQAATKVNNDVNTLVPANQVLAGDNQSASANGAFDIARDVERARSIARTSERSSDEVDSKASEVEQAGERGDNVDNFIENEIGRIDEKLSQLDVSEESAEAKMYSSRLAGFRSELKALQEENNKLTEELETTNRNLAQKAESQTSDGVDRVESADTGIFSSGASRSVASPTPAGGEDAAASVRVASIGPIGAGQIAGEASGPSGDSARRSIASVQASNIGDIQPGGSGVSFQLKFSELDSVAEGVDIEQIEFDFLSLSEDGKEEFMNKFFAQVDGEVAYVQQSDGKIILLEKKSLSISETEEAVADGRVEEARTSIIKRVEALHNLMNTNLSLDDIRTH